MRFRLGTAGAGQGGDSLTGGIGNAFKAFAMMPMMQAQAAEQHEAAEAKRHLMETQRVQAEAQAQQAREHAAFYGAQTREKETQLQRGTLPELIRTAALTHKMPLHQVPEFTDFAQTGKLPPAYAPPGDGIGPTLPKPAYADPGGVGGEIMRTLGLLTGGLAMGDKSIDNVAQAGGRLQQQDDIRRVQANPGSAGTTGQAYAAVEGKPLIDNIGNTGEGYNKFTGQGSTLNAGLRVLFDQGERAQIGQRDASAGASRASAANSYAAAKQHQASTDKIRQEIDLGSKGVLQQTDQGLLLVNPRDATSIPVRGVDGQTVGKAGGGNISEGERKAGSLLMRLRGSQQQIMSVLGETPGAAKPRTTLEMIRKIPMLGEAAANTMTPEARQQVEAAQLDMLDAALTLGTGAAYTREQLLGYTKSYFPQIGDKPKQIEDKQVRLSNIIRAAEIAAGRAAQTAVPVVPSRQPSAAPGAPEGSWAPGSGAGGKNVKVDW